jgi:putative MATE family efflux protein
LAFISKENFKKNVSLAWPLALNSILVQSMVVVDLMLVAPLGEIPIAALGIATAIIAFLIGTQYALANGTQMLIARAVGAGESNLIAATLAIGWIINVGFSSITFLALFFGAEVILSTFVEQARVALEAQRYLNVSVFMLLVSSVTQVMIVYFNGSGKTKIPMYGFMLEIPFNVVVSLVLIHGLFGMPELGLQGAAIGTFVAVCVRLLYLGHRISRDRNVSIATGFKKASRSQLKKDFLEIYPIAANFVTLTGGVLVYQLLFAQLNIYAYAAITLVMPWMKMGAQFINSWSHATAINVSQFLGKKDLSSIPEFVVQAVRITNVIALIICGIFVIFSLILPLLYPAMEAQTLKALSIIAPIYILTPLVRTYNTICGHTLRALGESMRVLQLHVITQWVICLPLLALFIILKLPLIIVFGVTLLEECLKTLSFRRKLHRKLTELRA